MFQHCSIPAWQSMSALQQSSMEALLHACQPYLNGHSSIQACQPCLLKHSSMPVCQYVSMSAFQYSSMAAFQQSRHEVSIPALLSIQVYHPNIPAFEHSSVPPSMSVFQCTSLLSPRNHLSCWWLFYTPKLVHKCLFSLCEHYILRLLLVSLKTVLELDNQWDKPPIQQNYGMNSLITVYFCWSTMMFTSCSRGQLFVLSSISISYNRNSKTASLLQNVWLTPVFSSRDRRQKANLSDRQIVQWLTLMDR